jgi:hypothetical protein
MTSTPPPDPWNPDPNQDPNQTPPPAGPAWDAYRQQPAQPGPPGYPPYPGQAGPPGYPGYPSYPAQPMQVQFDPTDPLVSNDYNGWFQRAVAIIKAGWKPLARLQAIILAPLLLLLIPMNIVAGLQQRSFNEDLLRSTEADPFSAFNVTSLLAASGIVIVVSILSAIWVGAGTLATARMVVTIATGGHPSAGAALRSIVGRIPAYLGWGLLAGLITLVALLVCILPVFYVAAVFAVLSPVVLFERGNPISRCFQLFHKDLGAALIRILTIAGLGIGAGIVFAIISGIGGAAFGAGFAPGVTQSTATIIASAIFSTVVTVLSYLFSGVVITPFIVATYTDLRARTEPFSTSQLIHG